MLFEYLNTSLNHTVQKSTGLVAKHLTKNAVCMGFVATMMAGCSMLPTNRGGAFVSDTTANALQAQCLKSSRYKQPSVSGQVIETQKYLLVTVINGTQAAVNEGELCIVDKKHQSVESTKVSDLNFLKSMYEAK